MKKVLIISYYWPPSGAIGVHRCLKFAKYLRDFGWEPIVYTAENAQYPYFDESNFKHIPEGMEVLKGKIIEPFRIFKVLSGRKKSDVLYNPVQIRDKKQKFIDKAGIWVRGNFFIPDARFLWIKPSLRRLSNYLKNNKVDAILSDGPPHTNTVIACKLAKKFNIPWLADYQDPWTQVDYYKEFKIGKLADKKHRKLEQEAFRTASKTTIASPSWKKDLEAIGAKNVDVIFWGYDTDDFNGLKAQPKNEFIISHAGLLGFDRNPETFFKILKELKAENKEFAKKMKIILAGSVDFQVKETIEEAGLQENTEYLGSIARTNAIQLTLNSSILLLPLNKADNAKGRIPGKLFEQMYAKVPILCFGPENSDVKNILNQTKTGKSFEYDDYTGIKNFIINTFERFTANDIKNNPPDISEYHVKNQVSKIAAYLDEITQ